MNWKCCDSESSLLAAHSRPRSFLLQITGHTSMVCGGLNRLFIPNVPLRLKILSLGQRILLVGGLIHRGASILLFLILEILLGCSTEGWTHLGWRLFRILIINQNYTVHTVQSSCLFLKLDFGELIDSAVLSELFGTKLEATFLWNSEIGLSFRLFVVFWTSFAGSDDSYMGL